MTSAAATPPGARILVVDDDPEVCALLHMVLSREGHKVDVVGSADAALAVLAEGRHDLVILDVSLGAADGRDVLAAIRRTSDLPVIMLSGRSHEADRVSGLLMGADDYIGKPFSTRELVVRVANLLKRSRPAARPGLDFGRLRIDTTAREVVLDDAVVPLTAKEFDLLAHLASSPRQVFSRAQLLEAVWESNPEWQDEATVTEHVRRVRRKVEDDPDNPRWITTVRGAGYRFEH
jgi:DNA-binding response OmpR family regulator